MFHGGYIQYIGNRVGKSLKIYVFAEKSDGFFLREDGKNVIVSIFPEKIFLDEPLLFQYNRCSAQKKGNLAFICRRRC